MNPPNTKTVIGLRKTIKGNTVYLDKAFDLTHGFGWHCQIITQGFNVLYGFSKNKFTAYRRALLDLE